VDKWENIAERKIREAMAEGAFDNLTGKGRPLDLEENPYEDPSLRMAHRLLRNNGFAPPWIEEGRDLERDIDLARQELVAKRSVDRFRERMAGINQRILAHNLKTPSTSFHMASIDAEAEIRRLLS
jgi:Domain of unknown function (DUF1992)